MLKKKNPTYLSIRIYQKNIKYIKNYKQRIFKPIIIITVKILNKKITFKT